MSRITDILAWIEADGYRYEKNNEHFEKYDPEFTKMFCHPKWTGNKNPDWYLGGASINYCNIEEWIEQFEDFIKGFQAFGACAIISHGDGDEVFTLGYTLDETFKKFRVELGDSSNYGDEKEIMDEWGVPLVFQIIHTLHRTPKVIK